MTASSAPVAVVTGAVQGIGRRVAEALADEGYALALIDLREPAEVLAAVRDRGVEALGVTGDVAAVVAFLADPERSGFVNGVALPVDGGWTADAGWTALQLRKRAGTTD